MLKVGVFGTGHLGKFHLNNWKLIPDAEIVGFFDPNDETAVDVVEKYQIKRFTDPAKLMDICDAADIVAPTPVHFSLCELAIRKSKHVFVEKPLANDMDEARTLLKLVKKSNVKLQVGHVERFNPAFLALQAKLQPMFIEVHRLAEFNPRGTEVSVILDLMIHDIDIILHVVNSEVKNIYSSGVAVMTDTPDIANVRIEFNNGCVANLTSSRISMKKMRKMRIFQKDAYIGVDFLNKKSEIISINHSEPPADGFSFDIETMNGTKSILVRNPEIPDINAIRMELEKFTESVLQNRPTEVSELDGYRAMDIAHQILQKIKFNSINS